jgi:hypothetical protein
MGISNNNQTPPLGNQPPATEQTPRKGYLYRCVENCVFNKYPYKAGDTVILYEKKDTVPHFVFAGEVPANQA